MKEVSAPAKKAFAYAQDVAASYDMTLADVITEVNALFVETQTTYIPVDKFFRVRVCKGENPRLQFTGTGPEGFKDDDDDYDSDDVAEMIVKATAEARLPW